MLHAEGIRQRQFIFAMWPHIAPPHPRRNACHAAQFQESVGCSPGIVPLDEYLPVFHTDAEAVVVALALHNADDAIFRGNSLLASHHFHVALEQTKCLLNNRSRLTLYLVAHGIAAVIPRDIGHCRQWPKAKSQKPKADNFKFISHS